MSKLLEILCTWKNLKKILSETYLKEFPQNKNPRYKSLK